MMKRLYDIIGHEQHMDYVNAIHPAALEDLENAIHVARLQQMTARLVSAGFQARDHVDSRFGTFQWNLITVWSPDGSERVDATMEEARRLLDTVANLPHAEAFRRWSGKIEIVAPEEYTEWDARRDTRQARAELAAQADSMSSADYALAYRSTSFMDLVN